MGRQPGPQQQAQIPIPNNGPRGPPMGPQLVGVPRPGPMHIGSPPIPGNRVPNPSSHQFNQQSNEMNVTSTGTNQLLRTQLSLPNQEPGMRTHPGASGGVPAGQPGPPGQSLLLKSLENPPTRDPNTDEINKVATCIASKVPND